MLSRTASNLFWLGRYIERAENTVRIIEAGDRMAKLPNWRDGQSGQRNEWESIAIATANLHGVLDQHDTATMDAVIDTILLDPENPSSVHSCLFAARTNGRAVRTALTSEMWESLNDTWLEFQGRWSKGIRPEELRGFLEWVRTRTTMFRGAALGTMMRDEAYAFLRAGVFIERADNTARILDVKYHLLLPENEEVGGSMDYHQWGTILRSLSALGSYHYVYRDSIVPWRVAELLILNEQFPRSLACSVAEAGRFIGMVAEPHGQRLQSLRLSRKLSSQLKYSDINEIFQDGLHEFLEDFQTDIVKLGDAIALDFQFDP